MKSLYWFIQINFIPFKVIPSRQGRIQRGGPGGPDPPPPEISDSLKSQYLYSTRSFNRKRRSPDCFRLFRLLFGNSENLYEKICTVWPLHPCEHRPYKKSWLMVPTKSQKWLVWNTRVMFFLIYGSVVIVWRGLFFIITIFKMAACRKKIVFFTFFNLSKFIKHLL